MPLPILSANNIQLGATAPTKEDAIRLTGQLLVDRGYVEAGYIDKMLAREQITTTYIGNAVAIPHGTEDAKNEVTTSGIVILQFPEGVDFGDGNIAKLLIGIAGKDGEHLEILSQIALVCSEEENVQSMTQAITKKEILTYFANMTSAQAVHFGAGNIGRGFIGNLLYQSGYETVFVDVNEAVVDALNRRHQYTVRLANEEQTAEHVKNVSAINNAKQPERVTEAIVHADIVTTAVGADVLPVIAEVIAAGLRARYAQNRQPLNIIACENMIGASQLLRSCVYEHLTQEERESFDALFHFPNAAVDRIVPDQGNDDGLNVTVEPFYEWMVDESLVVGEKPDIKGMTYVPSLTPYIERKLFTVNTGHAVAAYFGYLAKAETIYDALQDEEILGLVRSVLQETGEVLVAKHGFNKAEHAAYIETTIQRFKNPLIVDEVIRVGRSPMRKLGRNDRLMNPVFQYEQLLQKEPVALLKGVAAALRYDVPTDEEAVDVQRLIQSKGLTKAIETITTVSKASPMMTHIVEAYEAYETQEA